MTMRIQILSDLHLEFAPWTPPQADADVLVLAGDIHVGTQAADWITLHRNRLPRQIVYVAGNHEFYRGEWAQVMRRLRALRLTGLHFLENSSAVIEGVRFLGATLWTDGALHGDPEGALACGGYMNDYRAIRGEDGVLLSPWDTMRWHARSRDWLDRNLDMPYEGPTVVVTHHAPSLQSIAPQYLDDPVSAFFASRLDAMLDGRAALWVHGHTHASSDYRVGETRVIANPAGYPLTNGGRENPAFNPALVVEVA
ncbi:metallophosphoesterase [Niveibacterium sp. 24ML]|uniref:metallophosphoesterase n=1 Tax=Niveibacterium sp. 24ML TaxID=2985512 RepID=UPI00226FDD62|nr:metallophosphoesterase [Niveibacterium sp. 24ML]MCX9157773.1 metallophosphoesterase [Niveibacterium sp. 24ML]